MEARDSTSIVPVLLRTLSTLGDSLQRELIDEAAKCGEEMESELISILENRSSWERDNDEFDYWLPLHAIMILGLMGTERAGRALANALRVSSESGSELGDWLGGYWPALMQNKPDEALEAFEQMLEDRGSDEYCRIVSTEVLTAAAQRRGAEALLQSLERVARCAADEAESVIFRQHMAGLLLDFPRPQFRSIVESLADVETDIGVMYGTSEVEYAFAEGKDSPEWEHFRDPWDFYTPEARDMRLEAEAAELAAEAAMPYMREMPKIGRNDPCPCGSGRKYKKCCLGRLDG